MISSISSFSFLHIHLKWNRGNGEQCFSSTGWNQQPQIWHVYFLSIFYSSVPVTNDLGETILYRGIMGSSTRNIFVLTWFLPGSQAGGLGCLLSRAAHEPGGEAALSFHPLTWQYSIYFFYSRFFFNPHLDILPFSPAQIWKIKVYGCACFWLLKNNILADQKKIKIIYKKWHHQILPG